MGFWDELWRDMKDSMREMGREAWEKAKTAAKEETKKTWKDFKEHMQRERRHLSAPVPADVAQILAETPGSGTPLIPYRLDTAPFLDHLLQDSDFERGWATGKVRERSVRIRVPSKDAALLQAAMAYWQEHAQEIEEIRKNTEVPRDVMDLM